MATNFPGSVDSFPRPTEFDDTDDSGLELDLLIDNLSDALEKVEQRTINSGWGRSVLPTATFPQATAKPNTTGTTTLNRLLFMPIDLLDMRYTALGAGIAVAEAGVIIRMGLYRRNPNGSVGPLLLDAGTITTTTTANAAYFATIDFTPTEPSVFIALVQQSASTTLTYRATNNATVFSVNGLIHGGNGENQGTIFNDNVTAELPAVAATLAYGNVTTPVGLLK